MNGMIRGLEEWTEETIEFNREYGKLKMRAGVGIIDALENWYAQWKESKSRRARDEYMKWRVRLHRKWNSEPDFLEELDEMFNIGLYDGTIGKILWDIPPEERVNLSSGYNWRRDSGYALRGGSLRKEDAQDLVQ
jgi:hypothetical protein